MPAIVGPIQVVNIGGGTIHFGDTLIISPKSASKTVTGSGSSNTGGFIITNNGLSASNVLDTNLVDQPILGNN
ncbi:spore germination protein [Peribacillus tepidiphilus]|uniref:spore germination protein n=1 Tax=Peribacillus tepidiphilus TaxID=2652445 RepID=UPI001290A739|nr:spore germination protein [Peribacillus tepidiphilus]